MLKCHEKLEQYEQFKEFKDSCKYQVKLFQQSHSTINQTSVPPCIREVERFVSNYAYRLVLGQQSLVWNYKVEIMPEADERSDASRDEPEGTNFLITYIGGNEVGLAAPMHTSDGKTKSYDSATDCGATDIVKSHWTSPTNCSCQFTSSFGVPCRHILCVRLFGLQPYLAVGQAMPPLSELFVNRWVTDVPDDINIYEEAPEDVQDTDPSTSFVNLKSVLDANGYQGHYVNDFKGFDIHSYDQKFMALKYGHPNQGGWHIGKITKTAVKDEVQLSFIFSDQTEPFWVCDTDLCILGGKNKGLAHTSRHRKHSWLLLEPKPLATPTVADGLSNPSSKQPRERPQNKRRSPANGGPLS